jgi:flagellar motor switch protein FliM
LLGFSRHRCDIVAASQQVRLGGVRVAKRKNVTKQVSPRQERPEGNIFAWHRHCTTPRTVPEGISALVENSGLKPAELHQLRLLTERFFDALGESLTAIAAKPVKLAYLKLELQAASDFFAQPKPQHFTVLGVGGQPAILLRMDMALAGALVRSAIGGDLSDLTAAASVTLTPLEARVLARTIAEISAAAAQSELADLFANRSVNPLASFESGSPAGEGYGAAGPVTSASVECAIAGVGGTVTLAIPLRFATEAAERLSPSKQGKRAGQAAAEKARKALAAVPLELKAVLGEVTLSLGEIRSLAPGSVVPLQKLGHDVARVSLRCGESVLSSGTVFEDGGWYRFLVQPIPEGGDGSGDTGRAGASE